MIAFKLYYEELTKRKPKTIKNRRAAAADSGVRDEHFVSPRAKGLRVRQYVRDAKAKILHKIKKG